jgi:hypothetical protein
VNQLVFKINEEQRLGQEDQKQRVPVYARMMHEMLVQMLCFQGTLRVFFAIF